MFARINFNISFFSIPLKIQCHISHFTFAHLNFGNEKKQKTQRRKLFFFFHF